MDVLFEPPLKHLLAGGLLATASLFVTLSIKRFILAYRRAGRLASAQWVVRAMRCLIVALTAGAWAAAFFWHQSWLLIVGVVILGQELYEMAILGVVLRRGMRTENETALASTSTGKRDDVIASVSRAGPPASSTNRYGDG